MAGKPLPIFERRADDGRLLGYQVKVRKTGFPTVSRQFDRKGDAEKFAIDTLAQMERGTFIDRREIEATSLAEAIERYDREIGPTKKRPEYVSQYARHWGRQPLAKRYVATLRPTDFVKYRDDRLAEGLAGNSVRLELGFIRHIFTIGIKEWGWPCTNPVMSIRMPKVAKGRERRLDKTTNEEGRLLAACKESRSIWLHDIVLMALETGMRRGEILALQWKHIDLTTGTAHLPDTKNGDSRTVPLSSVALAILRAIPRSIDGRVFPIGESGFVHTFQRATEKARLEDFHFHDLRHEATSRFFERGLDMMEVASITGHKTLQMLKRYTHLRAEDLAKKLG